MRVGQAKLESVVWMMAIISPVKTQTLMDPSLATPLISAQNPILVMEAILSLSSEKNFYLLFIMLLPILGMTGGCMTCTEA